MVFTESIDVTTSPVLTATATATVYSAGRSADHSDALRIRIGGSATSPPRSGTCAWAAPTTSPAASTVARAAIVAPSFAAVVTSAVTFTVTFTRVSAKEAAEPRRRSPTCVTGPATEDGA